MSFECVTFCIQQRCIRNLEPLNSRSNILSSESLFAIFVFSSSNTYCGSITIRGKLTVFMRKWKIMWNYSLLTRRNPWSPLPSKLMRGYIQPSVCWLITCWYIHRRLLLLEQQMNTSVDSSTTINDGTMLSHLNRLPGAAEFTCNLVIYLHWKRSFKRFWGLKSPPAYQRLSEQLGHGAACWTWKFQCWYQL